MDILRALGFRVYPQKALPVYKEICALAIFFLVLTPIIHMYRITDFMIFCIFVMSFDLLYGYLGLLSFGHVLYLGAGVYISVLFSIYINSNPLLSLLAGTLGGGIIAAILGLIVVKLDGASFALVNLAFSQIGYFLVSSTFQELTHGTDGISSRVETWGFLNFSNEYITFSFILISMLLVFYFLRKLTSSPFGVLIRSIKENETRVTFLGYSTFLYKWITFLVAGTVASFAGGIYTLYVQYVSPTVLNPLDNIDPILAVLIGGAGNLYGAIAGGLLFMMMKDWLSAHFTVWQWVLGIMLLIISFWFRHGFTGFVMAIRNYQRKKAVTYEQDGV
jgi:branched-chain amino acid transport system permease protein